MATLVASQALNMKSGLDVLDSEVGIEQLISASFDGTNQVWSVPPAGYLEIDLDVISGDTSFSASFNKLELQTGPDFTSPAIWTLTNIPLAVNGSFSVAGDVINLTVSVPDMGQAVASVNFQTGEILSLEQNFSSSSYDGFVEYVLRQADTITGSSGRDNLLGFDGNDSISGGGGNDTLNGGKGNDVLDGGGGNDKLNGGPGADRLLGGAGKDTLIWGKGDAQLDGGGGGDTMKLTVNLDLTGLANSKFVNIEKINMTGGGNDTLTLDVSDVLDFSSSTNTLTVLGNSGDTVHRGSGWTQGADQVIGANTFHTYTKMGAALGTLLVDIDVTSVV